VLDNMDELIDYVVVVKDEDPFDKRLHVWNGEMDDLLKKPLVSL